MKKDFIERANFALNKTNINYPGKEMEALEFVVDTFDQATLIKVYGARKIQSIKSKGIWHDVSISGNIARGYSTCIDPTVDLNLNQNEVDVCDYRYHGTIDHNSLVATFRERFLDLGLHNEDTFDDTAIRAVIMSMIQDDVAQQASDELFNRNTDTLGVCAPGLKELFEQEATQTFTRPIPADQRLNPTGDPTDPALVAGQLFRVIQALPGKYRNIGSSTPGDSNRPVLAVSYEIFDALQQYYELNRIQNWVDVNGATVLRFQQYLVIPLVELEPIEMYFTNPQNIAIVMDLESDLTNMLINDGRTLRDLCLEYQWRIDFRLGILFGEGERIVWYRPA